MLEARELCKQLELTTMDSLFNYVIKLDIKISYYKKDLKLSNSDEIKDDLIREMEVVKTLQRHINKLLAIRESLTKRFNDVVARNIVKSLIVNEAGTAKDIEWAIIKVTDKKGGYSLSYRNYNPVFIECKYSDTKLYKMIKC